MPGGATGAAITQVAAPTQCPFCLPCRAKRCRNLTRERHEYCEEHASLDKPWSRGRGGFDCVQLFRSVTSTSASHADELAEPASKSTVWCYADRGDMSFVIRAGTYVSRGVGIDGLRSSLPWGKARCIEFSPQVFEGAVKY